MSNPSVLARLQRRIDRTKVAVKTRFGLWQRPRILVYRGHGTPQLLRVQGRVIEEGAGREAGASVSRLRNAVNTFRRMESDEIPGVRLRVRACEAEAEVTTDEEGFFSVDLECDGVAPGWHQVEAEMLDSPTGHEDVAGKGELLVIADDCELGYVSDMDDTVIETGATNKFTQTRLLLMRDALEHEPFPGVAQLYTRLVRGPDGHSPHPIFYVSQSAWGLYDLFVAFMEAHDIPRGPTFLMDAAIVEEKSAALGSTHSKRDRIDEILRMHPQLRLVLIGDSGQHDPELYLRVVRRWPGRVRAVWLRDVTDEKRDREVRAIVADIEGLGVPARACETTAQMAAHAEELGLVAR